MAAYYYADVRRYKTERAGESTNTLFASTKVSEDNVKTNTLFYIYYLVDIWKSELSTFSAWKATLNSAGNDYVGSQLVSPNSSTNENNGLAAGLQISVTADPGTTDTNVNSGSPSFENSHFKISFNRTAKTTNGQVVATPTCIGLE